MFKFLLTILTLGLFFISPFFSQRALEFIIPDSLVFAKSFEISKPIHFIDANYSLKNYDLQDSLYEISIINSELLKDKFQYCDDKDSKLDEFYNYSCNYQSIDNFNDQKIALSQKNDIFLLEFMHKNIDGIEMYFKEFYNIPFYVSSYHTGSDRIRIYSTFIDDVQYNFNILPWTARKYYSGNFMGNDQYSLCSKDIELNNKKAFAEIDAYFERQLPKYIRYEGEPGPKIPTDVKEGAWYYDVIDFYTQMFVVEGETFRPSDNATRGEFIEFVLKAADIEVFPIPKASSFKDVAITHPQFKYLEFAAGLQLLKGAGDCYGSAECSVYPDAPITRAEAATILSRAQYFSINKELPTFTDLLSEQWYTEPINLMAGNCVLQGDDGANTIRPLGYINRAEMATMIYRSHVRGKHPYC